MRSYTRSQTLADALNSYLWGKYIIITVGC